MPVSRKPVKHMMQLGQIRIIKFRIKLMISHLLKKHLMEKVQLIKNL